MNSVDRSESGGSQSEGHPTVPELVNRAKSGDHKAFERLYRLHVGQVYALSLRMTADPLEAESLTQEVFVQVWRKLDSYRGEGAFGAWIRRIAVNRVIENRRAAARQARWIVTVDPTDEFEMAGGSVPAKIGTSSPESVIDLERAIALLPTGARDVFVLHDVEGYRMREIAEIGGVAIGTVKAQLFRARRLLRDSLADRTEGAE